MSELRTGLLGLLLLVTLHPESAAQGTGTPAEAKVIEEVKAIDIAIWKALSDCDKKGWANLVADDVALITVFGGVMNSTQLLAVCGGNEWTMEPVTVKLYGNAAVVIGNHTFRSKKNPSAEPGRYVYTRLYERRNGAWKWVFGHHTTAKEPLKGF